MIEGVQVVSVPVSGQDRVRDFYVGPLGFELRTENVFGDGIRWIEVAPTGSATSLSLVTWFESMPPGSLQGRLFTVDDVRAAYEELVARGFLSTSRPGRCLAACKRCSATPTPTASSSRVGRGEPGKKEVTLYVDRGK